LPGYARNVGFTLDSAFSSNADETERGNRGNFNVTIVRERSIQLRDASPSSATIPTRSPIRVPLLYRSHARRNSAGSSAASDGGIRSRLSLPLSPKNGATRLEDRTGCRANAARNSSTISRQEPARKSERAGTMTGRRRGRGREISFLDHSWITADPRTCPFSKNGAPLLRRASATPVAEQSAGDGRGVNRISRLVRLPAARKIAPISQWEHVILSRVLDRRKLGLNRSTGSTRYRYALPRNESNAERRARGRRDLLRPGECVLSCPAGCSLNGNCGRSPRFSAEIPRNGAAAFLRFSAHLLG